MNTNKATDKKEEMNVVPKVNEQIPEKDLQPGNAPITKEEVLKLAVVKTKVEKGEDQHLYKTPAETPARAGDLTNDYVIEYNY